MTAADGSGSLGTASAPLLLGPNQPLARPYAGGAGIRAFRGTGSADDHTPEDFVGSTTTTFGSDHVGLTVLPDGRSLRDAVATDPGGWVGPGRTDTGLLVKILNTGERLFNHVHPDAAFARAHLGRTHGKTEAWIVQSTGSAPTGDVWLGWREDVDAEQLRDWYDRQDVDAMLAALHHTTVRAGDRVFVPAGVPHSIGPDITLVELQEPTDLSIILEQRGFPGIDPAGAVLGLDPALALTAVDRTATSPGRLAALVRTGDGPLLPPEASAFFRAELHDGDADLDAAFSVLVVLDGSGTVDWVDGSIAVQRGSTVLVPFGAGVTRLRDSMQVLRCRPAASAPAASVRVASEEAPA